MLAIRPGIQSLANGDLLSTLQRVVASFLPGPRSLSRKLLRTAPHFGTLLAIELWQSVGST